MPDIPMPDTTSQNIDPAATPEDDDAPQIAADDAGASALAERMSRQTQGRAMPEGDDEKDVPPEPTGG